MQCKVAYQLGNNLRPFGRSLVGTLFVGDAGVRIDGPVPFCADFSNIQCLRKPPNGAFVTIGSSQTAFVLPIKRSLWGVVHFVKPRLAETLFAELCQRVSGLDHCPECGSEARLSIGPCQRCAAKSRKSHCNGQLLAKVIAVLLAPAFSIYLGCYYHLSRRGIQEAKKYGSPGFLYIPWDDLIGIQDDKILDQSLSKHSHKSANLCTLKLYRSQVIPNNGAREGHYVWPEQAQGSAGRKRF